MCIAICQGWDGLCLHWVLLTTAAVVITKISRNLSAVI